MADIKSWAAAVCAAELAGSLAHLLSPPGNMQKVYRVVVSVFFLCAMALPLLSVARGAPEWLLEPEPDPAWEEQALLQVVERQTAELVARRAEELVREDLAAMGVAGAEISAVIHENDGGGIYIEQLVILLPTEEIGKSGEISGRVEQLLGMPPQLRWREPEELQEGKNDPAKGPVG
ncbi:MAG: stage III sporulation protein AF [Oscillospiraceae bacterium]|nr:stage III sporulation protein AF [Oscillospiraceae bacterium]